MSEDRNDEQTQLQADGPAPGTEAYYEQRFAQRQKKWEENKKKQRQQEHMLIVGGVCGLVVLAVVILILSNVISEARARKLALANVPVETVEYGAIGEAIPTIGTEDLAMDIMPEDAVTDPVEGGQAEGTDPIGENPTVESQSGDTPEEGSLPDGLQPEIGEDGLPLPLEAAPDTDRPEVLPVVNSTFTSAQAYAFHETDATSRLGSDQVLSDYAVLMDADEGTILRTRDAKTRINPASMTKILSCLVAAERIENLDDTFEITLEVTDFSFQNDCSNAGFDLHEVVTVRDLLYGLILPSGGDAAYALALYVAGSHAAFVDLMNEKLDQLGLSETAHFTNCAGLYDENHYCTAYDIGVILRAAMENPLAREVLSTHCYTTTKTPQHPDGIVLSNWFLRRIEDRDCGGTVVGAKTGYVVQSGNCAASYYTSDEGKNYICVTAKAGSSWKAIYDHVAVYNIYVAGNTGYIRGSDHQ